MSCWEEEKVWLVYQASVDKYGKQFEHNTFRLDWRKQQRKPRQNKTKWNTIPRADTLVHFSLYGHVANQLNGNVTVTWNLHLISVCNCHQLFTTFFFTFSNFQPFPHCQLVTFLDSQKKMSSAVQQQSSKHNHNQMVYKTYSYLIA